MALEEYRRKRDFRRTPEPQGGEGEQRPTTPAPGTLFPGWDALPAGERFCVQMHRASRLHWDLRLEHNGVLLSWAVPKGPTLDPTQKRLAMHVEDHPVEYGDFEGVIPDGYGAGTVMLWDAGTREWEPETAADVDAALRKGDVKFILHGVKLRGRFALIHTGNRMGGGRGSENAWLLIKKRDDEAVPGWDAADHAWSVKTGRTLEEIAAGKGAAAGEIWRSDRDGDQLGPLLAEAPEREMPRNLRPMLAERIERPFTADNWVWELKYDGVRALAAVGGGEVTLQSRSGRDETARYPELNALGRALLLRDALVDGEIVAFGEDGKPSFERLQSRINVSKPADILRAQQTAPVAFCAFDMLWAAGHDLRDLPLVQRKRALRAALRDVPGVLYVDHVERDGDAFFEAVKQQGLEGIVGKQSESRYETGRRSRCWVKVKAWNTQDCVIGGYTEGRNTRGALGALVLGVYDGDRLVHAGQAGSGLDNATIRTLLDLLSPLRTQECPFDPCPQTMQPATWVRPELVCEVRFTEWTSAGTMRHPTFLRLRPDVQPRDCIRERPLDPSAVIGDAAAAPAPAPRQPRAESPKPNTSKAEDIPDCVPWSGPSAETQEAIERLYRCRPNDTWEFAGRTLKLTNLDKLFWPDDGLTKRDMIAYYARFADLLLPYLRDRPLSTQVFPDGINGKSFWRKDKPKHAPDWIVSWVYEGEDASKDWIIPTEPAVLPWVANAGVIDLHPWHSRYDAPYQPDWAVFDLDPFEPMTFKDVVDIAKLVKAALDHYGLRGHCKTSGQTGLQIYVPIRRGPTYDVVRHWVEEVARTIGRVEPDRITWEWSVARRTGKLRIDYTQNILNKTLAAVYSLRPARGAPVSMPIAWEELDDPALRPDAWTIHTAEARVREVGDLFRGVLRQDQDLPVR
ncbi:MAG TPA: DNA ligase D [Candidatus Dormibacteraeota bacterium]|jgi:bifunctional non-homologous end joining protein LigD|nr:DNA ligase D [Candidatus Dormibacteraeota bacterium]